MNEAIYLDHCATTDILPEVAEAVRQGSLDFTGNPSSQHQFGRKARKILEDARMEIGQLLGAQVSGNESDHIVFTSGGTEANNLAIKGLLPETPPEGGRVVLSSLEHPSVSEVLQYCKYKGWEVDTLDAHSDGTTSLSQLDQMNAPLTKLVCLMLANNETGVLQPVQEAAKWCQDHGVAIHTDAVQVVGKLPIHFRNLGVSTLSLTAHKFHGPKGIGALLIRHGCHLSPIFQGGHQQAGYRPGTESVALVMGLKAALECWHKGDQSREKHLRELQIQLETSLKKGWPDAVILGESAKRVPHTTNIAFPGLNRQALAMALDLAGIACSTGSACASGASSPSPILTSMGCSQEVIEGSLRLSWGAMTTSSEIDQASERILNVCHHLRQSN